MFSTSLLSLFLTLFLVLPSSALGTPRLSKHLDLKRQPSRIARSNLPLLKRQYGYGDSYGDSSSSSSSAQAAITPVDQVQSNGIGISLVGISTIPITDIPTATLANAVAAAAAVTGSSTKALGNGGGIGAQFVAITVVPAPAATKKAATTSKKATSTKKTVATKKVTTTSLAEAKAVVEPKTVTEFVTVTA